MSLFKRIEKRATSVGLTDPEAWWRDIEPAGVQTYSGVRVNARTALSISAVYFCAGLIADAIGAFPIDTFVDRNGQREEVSTPTWLIQPNPNMTPITFWHCVVTSMLLEGNAFILVVRNDDGSPLALYPIPPDMVDIEDKPNGNIFKVNGHVMAPGEILHIPAFTLAGQSRGISVIEAARQSIGLGLTAEEFGARFFGQGTTLSGVIEVPNGLDTKEARRLKADFSKSNTGTKNSHAIGVLTGGATWKQVSITPEQAQFLETRKFTKSDIALFFRVPAHMVDPTVSSTWGSGIEEQNWAFVQNTLQPWVSRIEQALFLFLFNGLKHARFNMNSRLRAKTTERMSSHAKGLQNGVYCQDDIRAMEDLPPLPNGLGQKFYIPGNLVEVGAPIPGPKPQQQLPQDENNSYRFNPYHGKDGKFTSGPGTYVPIYQHELSNPNTPRSRAVTQDQFNALAYAGKKRLKKFRKAARATEAFNDDQSWESIKERAYNESREVWGGSTVDGHSGKFMSGNEDAYALTVKSNGLQTVMVSPTASREEFYAAMDEAKSRFGKVLTYQDHKLGVFHDGDENRIDIDPVLIVTDHHDVEAIGAFTHAVGGAYRFSDGNGYWPPYVEEGK